MNTPQFPTEPVFVGYLDGGNGTPAKGFKIPPPPADLGCSMETRQPTNKKLKVIHCETHDGQPLACIYGLPGYGADLNPNQMRSLAQVLSQIAADIENQSLSKQPEYEW